MAVPFRLMAVGAIAMAGAVGGAYVMGKRAAQSEAPAASVAPHANTLPAGHPAMPAGVAQVAHASPAAQAKATEPPAPTEGKVGATPNTRFTHFRVGNKNVKRILADGKTVWVGTSGGLIRYKQDSDDYKLYDVRSGLLSNGVFHVGKLQGRLVVGTYGGGMALLDEQKQQWETFNIPEGLGDAFVYDVLEARNGDVWIATWSGVNRVRGGALRDRSKWDLFTVENTTSGLPNDWVYGLAEGRNGDVWLATEGGLARYRGGKWDNWNHAKGLGAPFEKVKADISYKSDPSQSSTHHAKQKQEMGLQGVDVAFNPNYIVSLAVDAAGIVWAGTWGGGLGRFDGKTWRNYTVTDGLPGNHVFMLHRDPKGTLWIGTNNGLARMEGDKFKRMTTEDGLFSNAVFSMATTDKSVWVGSFGGVAQIRNLN